MPAIPDRAAFGQFELAGKEYRWHTFCDGEFLIVNSSAYADPVFARRVNLAPGAAEPEWRWQCEPIAAGAGPTYFDSARMAAMALAARRLLGHADLDGAAVVDVPPGGEHEWLGVPVAASILPDGRRIEWRLRSIGESYALTGDVEGTQAQVKFTGLDGNMSWSVPGVHGELPAYFEHLADAIAYAGQQLAAAVEQADTSDLEEVLNAEVGAAAFAPGLVDGRRPATPREWRQALAVVLHIEMGSHWRSAAAELAVDPAIALYAARHARFVINTNARGAPYPRTAATAISPTRPSCEDEWRDARTVLSMIRDGLDWEEAAEDAGIKPGVALYAYRYPERVEQHEAEAAARLGVVRMRRPESREEWASCHAVLKQLEAGASWQEASRNLNVDPRLAFYASAARAKVEKYGLSPPPPRRSFKDRVHVRRPFTDEEWQAARRVYEEIKAGKSWYDAAVTAGIDERLAFYAFKYPKRVELHFAPKHEKTKPAPPGPSQPKGLSAQQAAEITESIKLAKSRTEQALRLAKRHGAARLERSAERLLERIEACASELAQRDPARDWNAANRFTFFRRLTTCLNKSACMLQGAERALASQYVKKQKILSQEWARQDGYTKRAIRRAAEQVYEREASTVRHIRRRGLTNVDYPLSHQAREQMVRDIAALERAAANEALARFKAVKDAAKSAVPPVRLRA